MKYLAIIWVNVRLFLLLLLAGVLALYLSWLVNAQLGYGYTWLYHLYQTDKHIEKYAPQNRFRDDFEYTSITQHKAIFQSIVDSVHNDGKGLEQIRYQVHGKEQALLHQAEIIHLQDVAALINNIHKFAAVCLVLFLGLSISHRRWPGGGINASNKGMLSVALILLGVIITVFWAYGAKQIFYQMHIWIFPKDHQWFFYYQDSLMSTLMKAPDLFAGIAIQITLLAIFIFAFASLCAKKLLKLN